MPATTDIVAVNLERRLAVGDDNRIYAIRKLLDWEGDETDDPIEACSATVRIEEGCWLLVDLQFFKRPTT